MKYVQNPAELLVDSGLLFEINRVILHPHGLALAVTLPDAEAAEDAHIKIWDCRDDPEGIIFEDAAFDEGLTKFTKMVEEASDRLAIREKLLGYVVQGER